MPASRNNPAVSLNRSLIQSAITLQGFETWRSSLDSAALERPAQRPKDLPGEGRRAAVTALLYPVDGKVQLAVIRRHHKLTHHAGQLALAGGRQEPGESLQTTAMRETQEELGVQLSEHNVLGSLKQVYIPPSDFTLLPFVAWLDQRPEFDLCPDEVDALIEVPMSALLNPASQSVGEVTIASGDSLEVPCYVYRDHVIWGATALVISELVERIKRVRLSLHAGL